MNIGKRGIILLLFVFCGCEVETYKPIEPLKPWECPYNQNSISAKNWYLEKSYQRDLPIVEQICNEYVWKSVSGITKDITYYNITDRKMKIGDNDTYYLRGNIIINDVYDETIPMNFALCIRYQQDNWNVDSFSIINNRDGALDWDSQELCKIPFK